VDNFVINGGFNSVENFSAFSGHTFRHKSAFLTAVGSHLTS